VVRVRLPRVLWVLVWSLVASGAARAQHGEVEQAPPPWPLKLAAPDLRHALVPHPHPGLDLEARASSQQPHPLRLSLDLGVSVLKLAVHGDYRPGFAPFLGTSTTSLGGLRLRF
jgi:hypothetical protein